MGGDNISVVGWTGDIFAQILVLRGNVHPGGVQTYRGLLPWSVDKIPLSSGLSDPSHCSVVIDMWCSRPGQAPASFANRQNCQL